MTGRYPVRTGISFVIFASEVSFDHRVNLTLTRLATRLGAGEFYDSFVSGIPDSEITLAEALQMVRLFNVTSLSLAVIQLQGFMQALADQPPPPSLRLLRTVTVSSRATPSRALPAERNRKASRSTRCSWRCTAPTRRPLSRAT